MSVCVPVPAEPTARVAQALGLVAGSGLQKVGAGAKERLKEGKQLSFFTAASGESELRSFKPVSHVQNCSLSSGSGSLMAKSDGG